MQLRAFFDYDTKMVVVLIIPGVATGQIEPDPIIQSLSVQVHGAGEIVRKPFTMDGIEVDKTRGIVAELTELHKREPAISGPYGKEVDYCEHCNGLCHSYEGLSCDDLADGAWPCATMAIVEKYAQ